MMSIKQLWAYYKRKKAQRIAANRKPVQVEIRRVKRRTEEGE